MPEIQASPREVGILLTSPGSGPLDQDSKVILPGAEPQSPRQRKCDPNAETLPLSDNWTDDLVTSTQSCCPRGLVLALRTPHEGLGLGLGLG